MAQPSERIIHVASPKARLFVDATQAIQRGLADYPKALRAFELLTSDPEARGHWDMSNYITMRKLGYNDHGRVHALLTGSASVSIQRLLVDAQVPLDTVESGVGNIEDAFVVTILATMLHDIGNQVHRESHPTFSVTLSQPIVTRILAQIYDNPEQRIELAALIYHSIFTHDLEPEPLTVEAGVTAVADGTDITKGRGKKAFQLGSIDIHSISALAIDEVAIMRGENGVAVEIRVLMNNAAGIFQVEETLTKKVIASPIRNYVTVVATTEPSGEHDQRIIQRVRLHSREPRFVLEK
jgi:hypothetical protein